MSSMTGPGHLSDAPSRLLTSGWPVWKESSFQNIICIACNLVLVHVALINKNKNKNNFCYSS